MWISRVSLLSGSVTGSIKWSQKADPEPDPPKWNGSELIRSYNTECVNDHFYWLSFKIFRYTVDKRIENFQGIPRYLLGWLIDWLLSALSVHLVVIWFHALGFRGYLKRHFGIAIFLRHAFLSWYVRSSLRLKIVENQIIFILSSPGFQLIHQPSPHSSLSLNFSTLPS